MAHTNAERKIDQAKKRNTQQILNYPSMPGPHNMIFVFKDYTYTESGSGIIRRTGETISSSNRNTRRRVNSGVTGSVSMPIPTNLQDSYSVRIGGNEIGMSGSMIADGMNEGGNSLRRAAQDIQGFAGQFSNPDSTLENIFANSGAAARFFGRNALDAIPIGGFGRALDIGTGSAVNPHVALQFDGVDLKTHSFAWVVSPKNEKEAQTLKDIIRFIKIQMSPDYLLESSQSSLGRNLLQYPSLVEIFFVGLNQEYFYYFKPAMISSFSVNYSPNGMSVNRGGKPAAMTLNMSLTEARIHTREDFE